MQTFQLSVALGTKVCVQEKKGKRKQRGQAWKDTLQLRDTGTTKPTLNHSSFPVLPFLTECSCHERYRERRELQGTLNSTLIPNTKSILLQMYGLAISSPFLNFSLYLHQCRVVYLLKAVIFISTVSWENREKFLPGFAW